jgi:hypothetical protein
LRIDSTLCFNKSAVVDEEYRKLNNISTFPGTTFVAPVPPLIFEICHYVLGKYSFPSSQTVFTKSSIAGATACIGFLINSGYAIWP